MKMCPPEEKDVTIVALGDFKRRVKKDKIFKIRLDTFELDELNRITKNLEMKERATAFRYLLHHYDNIKQATDLTTSYIKMIQAKKEFENLLNKKD